ncbi:extracellular matrix regulator RemB [Paenibacillus septentrionalis]|uniref:Extracellular matrix regulator RemB n=1 Tax=Paenibacillus septentrionalis TaxID=429342 RepID=A0ABW1V6D9_9BACL
MYIHVGGEKIVRTSEIVAIFDITIESSSKLSKQFMTGAAKRKEIETIGEEEAKSIVITSNKVIYSPISSSTLKKRAHHFAAL